MQLGARNSGGRAWYIIPAQEVKSKSGREIKRKEHECVHCVARFRFCPPLTPRPFHRKCDKRGKEYSCFTKAAKDKRFRTVFANWKRRLARALKAQRKITGRAKSVILNVTATFNCRRKIHSSLSERARDLRRKKKKTKQKKKGKNVEQTGGERGRVEERQTPSKHRR